jgi:hypothetical protein
MFFFKSFFLGTICTSTTYTKMDNSTACLINLNRKLNYYDGEAACNSRTARLAEIKSSKENADITARLVRF